jgi:carbon-monoxide dehydrogenase medium subunit
VKPAAFEYHAPERVDETVALLAEFGDDAKVLAGGQSLVPMLSLRLAYYDHLVDVGRVAELQGIRSEPDAVVIGATTVDAAVEHDTEIAKKVPLLTRVTPLIGHFQIRNRGTVGGSLAHADPASELPAVALTLDADFELASTRGTRRVAAADFFEGTWTTAAADDELLVATHFPVWEGRVGFAFDEVARRHGDFALTGVAAAVELAGDGKLQRAAIGFLGMGSTPERARAAEAELLGASPPTAPELTELAQLAVRDLEPTDDVHASARYRTRVGAHLVERTLARALEAATHG